MVIEVRIRARNAAATIIIHLKLIHIVCIMVMNQRNFRLMECMSMSAQVMDINRQFIVYYICESRQYDIIGGWLDWRRMLIDGNKRVSRLSNKHNIIAETI